MLVHDTSPSTKTLVEFARAILTRPLPPLSEGKLWAFTTPDAERLANHLNAESDRYQQGEEVPVDTLMTAILFTSAERANLSARLVDFQSGQDIVVTFGFDNLLPDLAGFVERVIAGLGITQVATPALFATMAPEEQYRTLKAVNGHLNERGATAGLVAY